jgi:glycerophosphoryl diester phosphodiesterase
MILLDPDARPVVGHRGASGECPENTVVSFDRALEQQADALEFDVRVTADGVPVVMHDDTVDRTTNGSGAVRSYTLERIQELDAGGGQRVPTLDEVLQRYPDTPCIIEIKEPAASQPALEAVVRQDASDRVLIGSFVHAALRPFVAAGLHRSASRRETALNWAASRIGLTVPGSGFEAFTVPERHRSFRIVDRALVRAARRARRPVHVWTVDDPADAERLRDLGVSGIITNYPSRMRRG